MRHFDIPYYPFLVVVVFWWNNPVSYCQSLTDTIHFIPTIEITSSIIRQEPSGSISENWTGEALNKLAANTVADLLSLETGTFIKSYGLGSLATSSVRGGSAGHTLVLWNGLPIQSPMLGQLDLALLPVQSAESISFIRGGNTAMWGSGAIGGVLSLNNDTNFSPKMELKSNSQIGSFGDFQQQLKIALGNGRLQSVTRGSYRKAKNDFYYFLADGLPERQQTNARLEQQYLMQDLFWKINDRSQLSIHFWQQNSDRQIPPTNVQNQSQAFQEDYSTRFILDYKQFTKQGIWKAKLGYFSERLNYFDDLILLESRSRFRTYLAEVTKEWSWHDRHHFIIGNTHTQTRAWSAGYRENIPSEYKTALFASWKYKGKKLKTQVSLRQELVDGNRAPLVPVFGLDLNINPNLSLKGKVSRNYRLPTLNDRYWLPGGNPELLPESGWSQELTIGQRLKRSKFEIDASLTAFNRNIDNWILWSIREGQSFWSSNNITKVWSRGVEPRLSTIFYLKKLKLQVRGGYDFIRSTNQVGLTNPKMEVGDQLIYTPIHQAFGTFSLEWKNFYFSYQHSYTDSVNGINDTLDAYHVGNIRFQFFLNLNKYSGTFFFNLNNIWDEDYLVVERRPMPGIHFQTGFNLLFEKN